MKNSFGQTVKRCTECKNYSPGKVFTWGMTLDACCSENNRSLVNGSFRDMPGELRYGGGCGEAGNWFVPIIEGKANG